MTKEDWDSLIACPGWAALRGFMRDYRQRTMEKMAEGVMRGEAMNDAIALCKSLKDLSELSWDDVAQFYGLVQEAQPTAEDS